MCVDGVTFGSLVLSKMGRPMLGSEPNTRVVVMALEKRRRRAVRAGKRLPAERRTPRNPRRVGKVTAQRHPACAKFRESLTDLGHDVILAVERALRFEKHHKWPRVAKRHQDKATFKTTDRFLVMDPWGDKFVGRFLEKRLINKRYQLNGSRRQITLYVFYRLGWGDRKVSHTGHVYADIVAVPKQLILGGNIKRLA